MATTTAELREHWRSLKRGRPGRRFQAHYEAAHHGRSRGVRGRIILFVLALVCLGIGVVLVFIPGPAFVFFILGGGLLASESRLVARAMDWSEVRARRGLEVCRKTWQRLSLAGRIAVLTVVAGGAAGAAFFAYRWFSS